MPFCHSIATGMFSFSKDEEKHVVTQFYIFHRKVNKETHDRYKIYFYKL